MLNNLLNFINCTGFSHIKIGQIFMIFIGAILIYLAIKKGFEPLLLIPIGFGAILTNIPHNGLMIAPHNGESGGLFYYIYYGIKLEIFPPLIFLGIGALTDFAPLLANPVTFLLGAAAQLGVFTTYIGALLLGFTTNQASSIGIIGGADGPTAIFITSKLAPELLGAIAVSAYSYMALVPLIQPPIMRLLTTKEERCIKMENLRHVSKIEKIVFPIIVMIFCILLVPAASALIGMLMFGNLMKESGVVNRLTKTAQNELLNIVTIFLGTSVGMTMNSENFLRSETLKILFLGIAAFALSTAGGLILGKIMCFLSGKKINPLIGAAGVSAVPMAARVVHKVAQEEDPTNYLLMHAMGPNVAGVIGSAVVAGVLLTIAK